MSGVIGGFSSAATAVQSEQFSSAATELPFSNGQCTVLMEQSGIPMGILGSRAYV